MPLSQLVIPESPLSTETAEQLQSALTGLSAPQLAWVSGYLSALSQEDAPNTVQVQSEKSRLTILYGSQTGNARGIAESLQTRAVQTGIAARVLSTGEYRERDIAGEQLLVLVVSTQGEGEPPEDATRLYSFLGSKRAPALNGLKYAVLGLGDSSYEQFCKAARDFDSRLSTLGATAVLDRVDCDIDFEVDAQAWSDSILQAFSVLLQEQQSNIVPIRHGQPVAQNRYSKEQPYPATVITNQRITGDKSVSDVQHIELSIEPAALKYSAGDALGIKFRNDPLLVDQILAATGFDHDVPVQSGRGECSFQEALAGHVELTHLHPTVVRRWSEITGDAALQNIVSDSKQLSRFVWGRQILDLINSYGWQGGADELISLLQPMHPRLYSIASSPAEYDNEIHLTVGLLRYTAFGREQYGGASSYLVERLGEDDVLDVYVSENKAFRLPANIDTPIVMLGAGTGVAPFRAFMQQREAEGAQGGNWLFYGNRHFHQDFLYQLEWQRLRKQGLLDRIDVAFSRDTAHKIYVQQRMIEQRKTLFRWLEEGAHLYVCGSFALGKSVQQALLDVVTQSGGFTTERAQEYLDALRQQGRYHKDLY